MAAQRRAAARTVRDDLLALVEQTLIPELAQDPPHRLDVVVGEGDIGVIQADPVGHPLGELLPLIDVAEDALAAFFIEGRHAVGLDLALVPQAKLLFDLDLDRQAMRVPAPLAQNVVAVHRLVAGEHVLVGAGQHMVRPRFAVRSRRAFVKDIAWPILALALGALKDALLPPEFELLALHCWDVNFR